MKKINLWLLTMVLLATGALAFSAIAEKAPVPANAISQKELVQRFGFIDEDGDGINDLARDADNDGIPNCMDPDWTRPEDGTGYKNKYGYAQRMTHTQNRGVASNFNHGYNYLWNNNWSGSNGTTICDKTGPHGSQGRTRNGNRP